MVFHRRMRPYKRQQLRAGDDDYLLKRQKKVTAMKRHQKNEIPRTNFRTISLNRLRTTKTYRRTKYSSHQRNILPNFRKAYGYDHRQFDFPDDFCLHVYHSEKTAPLIGRKATKNRSKSRRAYGRNRAEKGWRQPKSGNDYSKDKFRWCKRKGKMDFSRRIDAMYMYKWDDNELEPSVSILQVGFMLTVATTWV